MSHSVILLIFCALLVGFFLFLCIAVRKLLKRMVEVLEQMRLKVEEVNRFYDEINKNRFASLEDRVAALDKKLHNVRYLDFLKHCEDLAARVRGRNLISEAAHKDFIEIIKSAREENF